MSAWLVSKRHVDVLVSAALQFPQHGSKLRFRIRDVPTKPSDYAKGEPWGPTAIKTFNERMTEVTRTNASDVGQMLWTENHKSLRHRYTDADESWPAEQYDFAEIHGRLDPVVVLKAIDCYEYQSCEHPEWEESAAYSLCDALRRVAIARLPGYESAPWGLDEESLVTRDEIERRRLM